MDFLLLWHSHSGSIGSYGLGRVHSSLSLPVRTVPIARTVQLEYPIGAFGLHIVRLSHSRHNEFANGAGPSEIRAELAPNAIDPASGV